MTEQDRNKQVETLRQRYQAIEAPPYLATRIRANVVERPSRRLGWSLVVAAGVAIVALLVTLTLSQQEVETPLTADAPVAAPAYPSMTTLAASMPPKPTAPIPTLASVGSVAVPAMPAIPNMPARAEPTG